MLRFVSSSQASSRGTNTVVRLSHMIVLETLGVRLFIQVGLSGLITYFMKAKFTSL